MFLGMAHTFARWAHESSNTPVEKAVFSTTATLLSAAISASSFQMMYQNALVAKNDIDGVFADRPQRKTKEQKAA